MTTTAHPTTAASVAPHPLAQLAAEEISEVAATLREAGVLSSAVHIAYLGLREPNKADVLAFESGGARPPRRARVMLADLSNARYTDVVVNLDSRAVDSDVVIDPALGSAPVLPSDFDRMDELVSRNPVWIAALAKRGLTPGEVYATTLSAGNFGEENTSLHRASRVVPFTRSGKAPDGASVYSHPVGGLCAYVDSDTGEIYELIDERVYDMTEETGVFEGAVDAPGLALPLKPLEIVQLEGSSLRMTGDILEWANWKMRVGFDHREGLIIRQASFNDGGVERPVLYRGSVAEMVVPYGDPQPALAWLNYFDVGEFVFGRLANSLELGCDCLGQITYLDVTMSDEVGQPYQIRNAICIHEEDVGLLWKHREDDQGIASTRRNRHLVVSFFITIGNYDYGFYWRFGLDGSIELECKLTGVVLQTPYREASASFQSHIAPGLGAPYHQHLFCARLDLTVDGPDNAVDEIDVQRVPISADNSYGNAFTRSIERVTRESDGGRFADSSHSRTWRVSNPNKLNRMGEPVAYTLLPRQESLLLADTESAVYKRATFATRQLWVTRYNEHENYPAGDFVNISPGGDGIPRWIQADRDLDGQDIVLWHTFGPTHFPRLEDWPIMPVDKAGFVLRPDGFFDRNPAIGLPPSTPDHCRHDGHGEHAHHGA